MPNICARVLSANHAFYKGIILFHTPARASENKLWAYILLFNIAEQ